jgi:hypothetical protein
MGGGIANYLSGTATILDSNIYDNIAWDGQGGGVYNEGSLTMSGCKVSGSVEGGGVYNKGTMSVNGGSISYNHGFGLENDAGDSTLTMAYVNISTNEGSGIVNGGQLILKFSTISDNYEAPYNGGGIANEGSLTVLDTAISDNTAIGDGGGIANGIGATVGAVTLVNCTVSGNRSFGSGGGIENSGDLDVVNSTIAWNAAFGNGGGVDSYDYATLELDDSTVSGNSASTGGGVSIIAGGSASNFSVLRNTIVAGNFLASTSTPESTPDDVVGLLDLSKSRSNLIGTGGSGGLANGVNSNLVGIADPKLGGLGGYGGPTQTMPPLAGSPAIDAGDASLLPPDTLDINGNGNVTEPLPLDEQGASRVSGGKLDIGACEYQVVLEIPGPQLYLRRDADGLNVDVWQNSTTPGIGPPTQQVPLATLATVLALGGGPGVHTLTLDFSNGVPAPTGVAVMFADGRDTLRIVGTPGDDTVTASPDLVKITAGTFGTLAITVPTSYFGVQFIGGSGGNDTLELTAGASCYVDAGTPQNAGNPNVSLLVDADARATLSADQRLATLTVNGLLDVGASRLWTTTPAATIREYIKFGYDRGWNALTGITSSVAQRNSAKYTIGYADGNDPSAQDAGIAVSPGQVLVQPTLVGDANLDGTVNFLDLAQLLGYKFNTHQPASYTDGDLNYDGTVDFLDLAALLSANYNTGATFEATPVVSAAGAASVAASPPASPFAATPLQAEDEQDAFLMTPSTLLKDANLPFA